MASVSDSSVTLLDHGEGEGENYTGDERRCLQISLVNGWNGREKPRVLPGFCFW